MQLLSPLSAAGFGHPVWGLIPQTAKVLHPSFLLGSDSGPGNMVPSGLPAAHMMDRCLILRTDTALC